MRCKDGKVNKQTDLSNEHVIMNIYDDLQCEIYDDSKKIYHHNVYCVYSTIYFKNNSIALTQALNA